MGVPGLINFRSMPCCSAQSAKAIEMNFGPLSMRSLTGKPRQAMTRSRTRMTLGAGRFRLVSTANTSRLKSSTTLKVRNRRPQNKLSLMKSMDQHQLAPAGTLNSYPAKLLMDGGPKFISIALADWAEQNDIELEFIFSGIKTHNLNRR